MYLYVFGTTIFYRNDENLKIWKEVFNFKKI